MSEPAPTVEGTPDAGPAGLPSAWSGDIPDLLAALLATSLIVLVRIGSSGTPRLLLSLGFAVYVPGRAIVANWAGMGRWSEAAMSMVFSLALLILATTAQLWAHYWHPLGLFQALAMFSLAGLAAGVLRRHRSRRHATYAVSYRPGRGS